MCIRDRFRDWIAQAQDDFRQLEIAILPTLHEPLSKWFGERVANKALSDYGMGIQQQRSAGLLVSGATGAVGAAGERAAASPTHTFFGA